MVRYGIYFLLFSRYGIFTGTLKINKYGKVLVPVFRKMVMVPVNIGYRSVFIGTLPMSSLNGLKNDLK